MNLATGYQTLSNIISIKNARFFFETLVFDGCFGKYILNVPFWYNRRCVYFLEYALTLVLFVQLVYFHISVKSGINKI